MSPIGYTTDFWGKVEISPPLNPYEVAYLRDLAQTRRMDRENGPFFVRGTGAMGQDHSPDVRNCNSPDPSQPGLWCQWLPSEDGTSIEWDGSEKFCNAPEWMAYIIGTFLDRRPDDETVAAMVKADLRLVEFTFDHVVTGIIDAQGEDSEDRWRLVVEDNIVTVQRPEFVWKAE